MIDAMDQLRASIESLLNEKGWTQKDLAERAGLSRAAMNRVLQGHTSPNIETVGRVARAFGVTIDELLRPASEPQLTAIQAERAARLLTAYVERYAGLDHLPAQLIRALAACRSQGQLRAVELAIEGSTTGVEEAAVRSAKQPVKSRDRA